MKETYGKDVRIGGNVKFCIFELRPRLSVRWIVDKCSLILFEKRSKKKVDKVHQNRIDAITKNSHVFKKKHIILIASDEISKIKGDELYTYEDVIQIIKELKLNHVSTLFGGYWEYILKREDIQEVSI